ncbi:hypothetical protein BDV93DRAFT_554480 [Ceratobasidium sp. AG-I]|nr:hypothetical protein BDV93DRAFT_554480 [Ceratobasidium sp. AG-I]
MNSIPFESRTGDWPFQVPVDSMGYCGQIYRWANINRLPLYFIDSRIGRDHDPVWISAPVLNEEELGSKFFGYGANKAKAKEDACRKMALSGHCAQ